MKKVLISAIALTLGMMTPAAWAQDEAPAEPAAPAAPQVNTLDELLNKVREGKIEESAEHRAREQQFRNQRDQQQRLLAEARQEKASEERRAERLEQTIRDNENTIAQLQDQRDNRLGQLKELFGVLQQVAGDLRSVITGSLVTVQANADGVDRITGIENLIEKASQSSSLPSIEEIEVLWYELQREMVESGKVVTFQAPVVSIDGEQETVALTRVGDFNLVANGKYYDFQEENGKVVELPRQPSDRFTSTVSSLENAQPGSVVAFGVDPTRGQLLTLFIQKPSLKERIDQGAEVGYLILALGAVGMLFVLERFIYLFLVTQKVRGQIKSQTPSSGNPLGRVLMVYEENKSVDVETLELKLDEAILKETPKLERFLTFIKLISAVAPLFGLLGTVTGMIETFQAITLFGTGDPKLMANGISQALVTTVLGLVVAIPTLLLHTFVSGMSKRVIHILEEQSAGIIAVHAEKENANA